MRRNARKAAFKKKARRRTRKRGYRIHSDVKEMPVRSKDGKRYAVCFVDDASRRGMAYAMAHKSEVLDMLKKFMGAHPEMDFSNCKFN